MGIRKYTYEVTEGKGIMGFEMKANAVNQIPRERKFSWKMSRHPMFVLLSGDVYWRGVNLLKFRFRQEVLLERLIYR